MVFKAERTRLAADHRALETDRMKLERQQNQLARRLARLSGQAKRFVRATVTASCRGQRAEVGLAYVVPSARWRPEYDLNYQRTRSKGRATLTVSAIVEQSTGEDWQNVKLRLSTARPKLGADAPRPASIVVGGDEKDKERVLVQGYEKRDTLATGDTGAGRGPSAAQLDDGGNTVALTLPGRVTVLADGRKHWFPVDRTQATAEQRWVAVPRLKHGVFRVVKLKNPARYPLLAGRINSFVQGAFVGRAPLAFTGAGEPLEVSLGLEPGLELKRAKRVDKEAVKGFLSKSKHLARAFRSTIANRTSKAITVEVREQVPVAQNEAIKVQVLAAGTTPNYQLDKDRGLMTWAVQVPARAEKKLDIAFEIQFPDDWKTE